MQAAPADTDEVTYAVTDCPLWIICPLKEHDAAPCTVQEALAYEPESTPLLHVRVCEIHWLPLDTEEDWYAVTDAPLATLWLLNVHDEGAAGDWGGGDGGIGVAIVVVVVEGDARRAVVALVGGGVGQAAIVRRVFGPIRPHPVVAGEPEETMPLLRWNACTAACVIGPK
jgi:hypothetical protein